jgi:hypothetical protein
VPVDVSTALSTKASTPCSVRSDAFRSRSHGERIVAGTRTANASEQALRQRKAHVDGRQLVEDEERRRVVRLHEVAGLHEHAADASGDRRSDLVNSSWSWRPSRAAWSTASAATATSSFV